jgi:hypothetical protein
MSMLIPFFNYLGLVISDVFNMCCRRKDSQNPLVSLKKSVKDDAIPALATLPSPADGDGYVSDDDLKVFQEDRDAIHSKVPRGVVCERRTPLAATLQQDLEHPTVVSPASTGSADEHRPFRAGSNACLTVSLDSPKKLT